MNQAGTRSKGGRTKAAASKEAPEKPVEQPKRDKVTLKPHKMQVIFIAKAYDEEGNEVDDGIVVSRGNGQPFTCYSEGDGKYRLMGAIPAEDLVTLEKRAIAEAEDSMNNPPQEGGR